MGDAQAGYITQLGKKRPMLAGFIAAGGSIRWRKASGCRGHQLLGDLVWLWGILGQPRGVCLWKWLPTPTRKLSGSLGKAALARCCRSMVGAAAVQRTAQITRSLHPHLGRVHQCLLQGRDPLP